MRRLVCLLSLWVALSVLSAMPVHAQIPNLGDLGGLFKKSKNKPITVSVNGKPAGNALQDHGTVYVPLSVFQSVPNMTATYDAGTSTVGITPPPAIASAAPPTSPTAAQTSDPASPTFSKSPPLLSNTSPPAGSPAPTPAPNTDYIRSPGLALVPGSIQITDEAGSFGHNGVHDPISRLSGLLKDTSDVGEVQGASVIIEFYDADGKSLGVISNTGASFNGMTSAPEGTSREVMFHMLAPYRCRSYKILAIYDHPTFLNRSNRLDGNIAIGGQGFEPTHWKLVSQVKDADGSIQFEGGNQIAISHEDQRTGDPLAIQKFALRNPVGFSVHCSPLGTVSEDGKYLMRHGKEVGNDVWDSPVRWGYDASTFSREQIVFEATALATKQNWTVTLPENTDYKLIKIYTRDTPLAYLSSSILPHDHK